MNKQLEDLGDKKVNTLTPMMSRATNRIDVISKHVRELQKNNLKDNNTICDIRKVIEEVVKDFEYQYKEKNIKIDINCPSNITIKSNIDLLKHQILSNLLSNSIKFSNRESRILIKVEVQDSKLSLKIIDHGTGLTRDQLNNFKNKIRIYSKSGTEAEPGTGLGLLIIQDAVDKIGAVFSLESPHKDGSSGTEACVQLCALET